jgi:hypothetical protein
MAERKQTPNVLDEMLGGSPAEKTTQKPVRQSSIPKKTPAARTRKISSPKPKVHEYQIVSFQDYKGWRVRFVNGQELQNWMTQPVLHEFVQKLASEGWAVRAMTSGQNLFGVNDKYQIIFERPRSS